MSDIETHLDGYPSVIQVPVAWGEMDAFGHVNNAVYFRYFESGRLDYFQHIGYLRHVEEKGVGPILASTQCRFRLPLTYPDTVSVGARVLKMGQDRFLMHYRVISHSQKKVAAQGDGLIVSYDYGRGCKVPIPPDIRRQIEVFEGHTLPPFNGS